MLGIFFFFNDTATTEIYTLSLHDALPICVELAAVVPGAVEEAVGPPGRAGVAVGLEAFDDLGREGPRLLAADRKSTRLNSSHANISYAVFCLKKKKM